MTQKNNSISVFVRSILSGKTLGRTLFNQEFARHTDYIVGAVLDLAGGASPSYRKLLPTSIQLTSTDYHAAEGVVAVDINMTLPFLDAQFDTVLFCNALYIAEDPTLLMKEIHRVLKIGGHLVLSNPFIGNEMPEPHDYQRFSAEGLMRLVSGAQFIDICITRIGERFSAAANLLHDAWFFSIVRLPIYGLACLLDRLIPIRVRELHPAPLVYFLTARRDV